MSRGIAAHTVVKRSAEDVLYRRSKLGLHVPPGTTEVLETYLARKNF